MHKFLGRTTYSSTAEHNPHPQQHTDTHTQMKQRNQNKPRKPIKAAHGATGGERGRVLD